MHKHLCLNNDNGTISPCNRQITIDEDTDDRNGVPYFIVDIYTAETV